MTYRLLGKCYVTSHVQHVTKKQDMKLQDEEIITRRFECQFFYIFFEQLQH